MSYGSEKFDRHHLSPTSQFYDLVLIGLHDCVERDMAVPHHLARRAVDPVDSYRPRACVVQGTLELPCPHDHACYDIVEAHVPVPPILQ